MILWKAGLFIKKWGSSIDLADLLTIFGILQGVNAICKKSQTIRDKGFVVEQWQWF